jgi:GDP-D-mannose dehydratase
VHGAIHMLALAKRLKCRIVQASTSEVYGDPSVHSQTEAYWDNVKPYFDKLLSHAGVSQMIVNLSQAPLYSSPKFDNA